jgi:Rrf2 family transcriptional regulator, iron-sulfur cluster assembly transcription factor
MGMIFSRSSQYAIQALVFLATQPAGAYVMCREMAGELGLPLPYLSKLMLQLARVGIVESSRGRLGGFRLLRSPEDLSLKEIIALTGGERQMKECLLGFKDCSDETACAMHCEWRPVKEVLCQLLEEQSVGKLARAVQDDHPREGEQSWSIPPR